MRSIFLVSLVVFLFIYLIFLLYGFVFVGMTDFIPIRALLSASGAWIRSLQTMGSFVMKSSLCVHNSLGAS